MSYFEIHIVFSVILGHHRTVSYHTWTSSYCVISYLDIIILCHAILGHHRTVLCHTWTSSYCAVSYLDIIILYSTKVMVSQPIIYTLYIYIWEAFTIRLLANSGLLALMQVFKLCVSFWNLFCCVFSPTLSNEMIDNN